MGASWPQDDALFSFCRPPCLRINRHLHSAPPLGPPAAVEMQLGCRACVIDATESVGDAAAPPARLSYMCAALARAFRRSFVLVPMSRGMRARRMGRFVR